MSFLQIEIPDHLLISMNETVDSLKQDIKFEFAKKLFQKQKLTISQASEFCSLNIKEFMNRLSQDGIPVIDYDPDELEREVTKLR